MNSLASARCLYSLHEARKDRSVSCGAASRIPSTRCGKNFASSIASEEWVGGGGSGLVAIGREVVATEVVLVALERWSWKEQ